MHVGDGFIITSDDSGSFTVTFGEDGMFTWVLPANTEIFEVLDQCLEMAELHSDFYMTWERMNRVAFDTNDLPKFKRAECCGRLPMPWVE